MPKILKCSPKLRNFAKFGHTVVDVVVDVNVKRPFYVFVEGRRGLKREILLSNY